jgi:antitoxin ParD1/3/4
MARRRSANISLTPELEAFLAAQVASGRYQSASEVVREGLRLIEERTRRRVSTLAELRREVKIGMDQARSGELLDGPSAFRRIRTRLAKQIARAGGRRRAG